MDERIEVSVEHPLRISRFVAGSGVLELLVGVKDIAPDPFAAEAGLRPARGRETRSNVLNQAAKPPGAAGICKIVRPAEPDPTQFDPTSHYYDPASDPDDPRWDWVIVAPVRALRFVPLDELKAMPELAGSRLLAKGNRLSVLPLTDAEFDAIVRAGRKTRR